MGGKTVEHLRWETRFERVPIDFLTELIKAFETVQKVERMFTGRELTGQIPTVLAIAKEVKWQRLEVRRKELEEKYGLTEREFSEATIETIREREDARQQKILEKER